MKTLRQSVGVVLLAAGILTLSATGGYCASRTIDDFSNGLDPGWKEKVFNGRTIYTPTMEDGHPALKAVARASASGLFYKIKFDCEKYPILRWSWKINHVVSKGNALTKEGDDYPARVYVVFPSLLFWKTKALNYVWANRLPKGAAVPNKYTSNAMMIAVESGPVNTGRFIDEERNICEDYRRLFKSDPPKVGAIAIMSDTDTTREESLAWYGPITINK